MKVGNIEVLSLPGLSQNSKQLETSISNLKQMKDVEFVESNKELYSATEDFKEQKSQYASLIGTSSELELDSAIQTEKYEVEYLWVKLGNHATKNGITLKMDVAKGASSEKKMYNLQFTATGNYANVTDFIYEIENDSTLGFKIENFKLLPSSTTNKESSTAEKNSNTTETTTTTVVDVQNLVATFTVKDVYIELDQISNSNQNNNKTNTNTNTNTTSTNTNTTNQNTTIENNDQDIDEIANSIQ